MSISFFYKMSKLILNNFDWVSKVQELVESLSLQNSISVSEKIMADLDTDHKFKLKFLAKEFTYASIAQPQNCDTIVAVLNYILTTLDKEYVEIFNDELLELLKKTIKQTKYFGNLQNIHFFMKQLIAAGLYKYHQFNEDISDVSTVNFTFPPESIEFIIQTDDIDRLIENLEENLIQKDYKSTRKCFELLHCDQLTPSLTQISALYGSVKCFNYLMSIGVPFDNINDYAICSGSSDILKHCVNLENSLYKAVISRKFSSLKYIIQNFMNPIDPMYSVLDKAFMYACIENDYRMIDELYNNSARSFLIDGQMNAIHGSVLRSNIDVVEFLLKIPATSPNEILRGTTPIIIAAENNEIEIVKALVARDDMNYHMTAAGKSPLFIAAEKNFPEIVSLISKAKNVDLNEGDNRGNTPLSIAIKGGYKDIVEELAMLENTDINMKDASGENPLFLAVSLNKSDIAEILLSFEDINVGDLTNSKESCFLAACRNGNFEIAKLIYERSQILIKIADNTDTTPLIAASQSGNLQLVEFILEKIENVNDVDVENKNAFYHACEGGYIDIVKKLDERKSDKNIISLSSYNPFTIAVCFGRVDVVKYLIEDKEINKNIDDWVGRNPISLTAANNQAEILNLILQKLPEIDVNKADSNGMTPLMTAVNEGYFDIVEILLKEKRVDLNAKNKKNQTAFEIAARVPNMINLFYQREDFVLSNDVLKSAAIEATKYSCIQNLEIMKSKGYVFDADVYGEAVLSGNNELIEYFGEVKDFVPHSQHFIKTIETDNFDLFEKLASYSTECFSYKTINGDTLLHKCAERGLVNFMEFILKANKIDINAQNNAGQTAFFVACKFDQFSVVELLSEQDSIDMELADKGKRTPLYAAASCGNANIVSFLIEAGVNVNTFTVFGETPLYAACSRGFSSVVRALISIDYVDVNAVTEDGSTPLFTAVINNHEGIVSLLLSRPDINATIPDKTGETPLQNAINNGFRPIAKLLANHLNVELPEEHHEEHHCDHCHDHSHNHSCGCGHCH